MKTKTVASRLALLAITIAAALLTQPMHAGAIDNLVFTENSSTSLTATLNGNALSVTRVGTDGWFVTLAGVSGPIQLPGKPPLDCHQFWTEPGAASFPVNAVTTQMSLNRISVTSDLNVPVPGLPDGTQDTMNFSLSGNPLFVTFFDKGDVATAPDTGTTGSLFGLGLMGLAFLRRKLC
jgi:hypothetical protein